MSDQITKKRNDIVFHIDYLSMTIFMTFDEFRPYWGRYFQAAFGDLVDTERRTAFFKTMWAALHLMTV